MRTEVIQADTVDEAVEQILHELREDTSTRSIVRNRENVIYFDGWDGLGASAVLRAVGQRLDMASSEPPEGLQFDQIIYIDCSKWDSRRALQRVIVEQLELPAEVMEMLDRQDEDDDFNGVAQGSRNEMPDVLDATYQHMQMMSRRFLVIFQNGSSEEIDLTTFGFPVYGYLRNKLLWTFQGSLRLYPRTKVDRALKSTATTDIFLSASRREQDPLELWRYLVCQEAVQVAHRNAPGSLLDQPALISECFLYTLKQSCMGSQCMTDYDFNIHCGNYWICDGIIHLQKQGDGDNRVDDDCGPYWRAADTLKREMRLDVDYCRHDRQYFPTHLVKGAEIIPCWTSSYRVTQVVDDGTISNGGIFQHYNKLCVLKLSYCSFSFSSPPFLHCRSLRFLWLDHCKDSNQVTSKVEASAEQEVIRYCFQRLWVLDVRYTPCEYWILSPQMLDVMIQLRELNVMGAQDWDIGQLRGRLPNIRKLRVTKSSVHCSGHSQQDSFQGMNKMELLDFSGNHNMKGVTEFSEISTSNNCLETMVIIDGSGGLQNFSLKGCANVKNLLLSGLFEDLRNLDLSGTVVKTVDLSAMTAPRLDKLFLNDCHKLCAIIWPPEDKRKSYLNMLHIDTTWLAASSTTTKENSTEGSSTMAGITTSSSSSLSVVHGGRAPSEFDWCIRVRDARLLRSLMPFEQYFEEKLVHVEIYSPVTAFSSGNDNKAANSNNNIKQQHVSLVNVDKPTDSFLYADVEVTLKYLPLLQPSKGDAPILNQIWPCPSIPSHHALTCYTHIQDHQFSTIVPDLICHNAYILHVHDSLSINSIPGPAPALGSAWYFLEWCRIERCPKLEHVFTAPQLQASGDVAVFNWLRTFWASELSKAHYIWNWTSASVFQFQQRSFEKLELLHMDFCPRVIHVLPLALEMVNHFSLGYLETVEIMWCGDLREVFPLYTKDAKNEQQQQQSATATVHFKSLKRIHLHELPKLQGICGQWRISAPELETVKIRGCWSLKRLPAVGNNTSKKVECDCEKEWWDTLEWDGVDANHHPSLYKATHSKYYKKTYLKGSVLR